MKTAADIEAARVGFRTGVRDALHEHAEREREIARTPEYDREPYAERQLRQDRAQLVTRFEDTARTAFAASAKVIERAEAAYAKAIDESDSKVNPRRARELADELRGRLALVQPSVTGGDTRLRALSKMIDEAITTLDPNRLRAVWMVGSDLIDRGESAEPALARTLGRQLMAIAADERADVDRAEAELREARVARAELRREILDTEGPLTGRHGGMPGTGWARDVLGEKLGYTGEVVSA